MSNYENQNTETPPKWRAWMHIGIGIIYCIFGIGVLYVKKFGSIDLSEPAVYGMFGLLLIYGAFRIWRGVADIKIINSNK